MGKVHLYPVEGAHIYPYPAQEMDVDAALADELLAYQPAAFTTEPPAGADPPKSKPRPPRKAAAKKPETPVDTEAAS